MGKFSVGDTVKLLDVPHHLIHDLPEEEQKEILSFIGKLATITEIDERGYNWIGFGETIESDQDTSIYSGHSFAIEDKYLKLVNAG